MIVGQIGNGVPPFSTHGNARPIADRLLAKVAVDGNGCWRFQGAKRDGYGLIGIAAGRCRNAHLVSYELFVGPVPEGLELDHLCRVRDCVNPYHLEPVTKRENMLRGSSPAAAHARQTHCKRGHEFDEANTAINPQGGRVCRACERERGRRRR